MHSAVWPACNGSSCKLHQPAQPRPQPRPQEVQRSRRTPAQPGVRYAAVPPVAEEKDGPLTVEALSRMPPEVRKQQIGERLFPLVSSVQVGAWVDGPMFTAVRCGRLPHKLRLLAV